MSKPWPKATPESERAPRQRSETKALFRLGDKVVEADDIEALRRESGMHPRAHEPRAADTTDAAGASAQRVDVLLWFADVEEPVRARAELRGSRLTLRAPLSLFENGSEIHYTVIDSGAVASARVQRVALTADPDQPVPVLEVELLGDAPAIDTTGFDKLEATGSAAADADPTVEVDLNDTIRTAAFVEPPLGRSGRWLGLLCAGAIGVAGGAAAMKRWSDYEQALRSDAAREHAAREAAAAAAATASAAILFRAVPDEVQAPPPAPAPSLLLHDVLPAMDAIASNAPAAPAAPATRPPAAEAKPASDREHLPRVTVEDQRTTIVIPMRGNGDGMRASPLSTPGVMVTLPKAFALIPSTILEPARGLARSIRLRKFASGTQVRVTFRSMAVRPRVAYDPAVGVEITLQRTW